MTTQATTPASTASRIDGAPIFGYFLRRMPGGLLLNLGSGATGVSGHLQTSVNVDLRVAAPETAGWSVQADAQMLPFTGQVFDGAVLKDVVEHVADPAKLMREVYRVSKPGARVLITTPRAVPRAVWADYTHIRGFTRSALSALLRDTGWVPLTAPRRLGGFPGAGRLGLTNSLLTIMRLPGLGHWLGTNWFVIVRKQDE